MEIKKLTPEQVKFTWHIEKEKSQVYVSTEGQDFRDTLIRVSYGDITAWCRIVVTATWKKFVGKNIVGCIHFKRMHENQLNQAISDYISDHRMREKALDCLQEDVEAYAKQIAELL